MIKYSKYTTHTFLSPWWCRKLIDSGIKMDNAVWFYIESGNTYYIVSKDELKDIGQDIAFPTYTLSDILYILDEYPYVDDIGAPLRFVKDAPFYIWYYNFRLNNKHEGKSHKFNDGTSCLEGESETPLEAAAILLLKCKNNTILFSTSSLEEKYDEVWRAKKSIGKITIKMQSI